VWPVLDSQLTWLENGVAYFFRWERIKPTPVGFVNRSHQKMLESAIHDQVRELERKLRDTTPASKADIDELSERLAVIEHTLAAMGRAMRINTPPGSRNQRSADIH
jgi:hypothetical protein